MMKIVAHLIASSLNSSSTVPHELVELESIQSLDRFDPIINYRLRFKYARKNEKVTSPAATSVSNSLVSLNLH